MMRPMKDVVLDVLECVNAEEEKQKVENILDRCDLDGCAEIPKMQLKFFDETIVEVIERNKDNFQCGLCGLIHHKCHRHLREKHKLTESKIDNVITKCKQTICKKIFCNNCAAGTTKKESEKNALISKFSTENVDLIT